MQVLASLPDIIAPPPDARVAVNSVSQLCLETCVNVFGRDVFLAEKPNDDSLGVPHPSNEKSKRTDLATIILHVLVMWCHCDSLFQAAQERSYQLLDGNRCGIWNCTEGSVASTYWPMQLPNHFPVQWGAFWAEANLTYCLLLIISTGSKSRLVMLDSYSENVNNVGKSGLWWTCHDSTPCGPPRWWH
jgi:hypothetical protein